MRISLLGIVSRFGLESLVPESAATLRWLLQATARHPVACVWATLQQDTAAEIQELLAIGDGNLALRHLAAAADRCGPVSRGSVRGS